MHIVLLSTRNALPKYLLRHFKRTTTTMTSTPNTNPSTRSTTPLPPYSSSSSSSPTKHIKVLLLHGYTQNGALFTNKTKALTKYIEKQLSKQHNYTVSFDSPTAPLRLRLRDIPGVDTSLLQGGGLQNGEDDDSSEAYGWWRKDDATGAYKGMEECWAFLSKHLDEHGPYTGVIGFSQGACLAAMLASVLEPNRQRPPSFTTSHPPISFAITYCGFRAAPTEFDNLYKPKIQTPVLHVIGSLDTVMEESRSTALVDACEEAREKKRVVYHPGGHYVVVQKPFLVAVGNFVEECLKHDDKSSIQQHGGEEKVEDMDMPF